MKRRSAIAVILVLIMALASAAATPPPEKWIPPQPPADFLVDQQYDPSTYGSEYWILEETPIGQEFMPEAELLVGVAVEIGGEGEASIKMSIREENIGGRVIYTSIRSVGEDEEGWLLFRITPGIQVQRDQVYVVELEMLEGNRSWKANQLPVLVNPFHRGRAVIGGVVEENEDLHVITYTRPVATLVTEEYIYTGAPAVSVSTKTVKEFTTVTATSTISFTLTQTSTHTSTETFTTTLTETTTATLREYVPPTIYGLVVGIMLAILAAILLLKWEEHRRPRTAEF